MRKILVMLASLAMLAVAAPAQAAPWESQDMYHATWPSSAGNVPVLFEDGFGAQARATAEQGFEVWDNLTGRINFMSYASASGQLTLDCGQVPNGAVWVGWGYNSNPDILALGANCPSNGDIEGGWIMLNAHAGIDWNIPVQNPGNVETDLLSVVVHEVGHVMGSSFGSAGGDSLGGHWEETSNACPTPGSTRETMCPEIEENTTYARTLVTDGNDINEFYDTGAY